MGFDAEEVECVANAEIVRVSTTAAHPDTPEQLVDPAAQGP